MTETNIPAELEKFAERLRLYAKALSGREIHLAPRAARAGGGAGWRTPHQDDQVIVIELPAKIDRFPAEKDNFNWYKVILTHQAGHVEFGTFDFVFAKPARQFDDWRSQLAAGKPLIESADEFGTFWQLFPDIDLAAAIFELVEDSRIDAHVLAAYPGIRPLYQRVANSVRAGRPRLALLPLREGFLEALLQLGLGGDPLAVAPLAIKSEIKLGAVLIAKVRSTHASVEDSAEATLRLYELAANLPNRPAYDGDDECEHDRHQQHSPRTQAPDALSEPVSDDDDMPFAPPQEVEFRPDSDGQRLRRFESKPRGDEAPPVLTADTRAAGPLTRDRPFTYLYPEWDFRGGAYRQHWCRVRERVMDQGSADFYMEALAEHRPLVGQVVNRIEHLIPELFRKVTRRDDGEDLDLDAVIERFVDRRTGGMPSEQLYWRRERTQRDVAVAVLLDMSATTDEFVQLEAAKAHRPTGPSAQAYSDYLKRLAAGVDQRGKLLRRRTIDIEKQAAIVLCQALEKIGDSYAVYAFSGSGRAEVELHVVKDFHERLTQRIGRRIDRIQPAHGTRMGAAIRHALGKLERVEANTRLLFLLSDGRPYDRDYGRDDADQEYALQDTRQALLEARRRKIRPFCLTIDRDGEDYLRQMCHDIPYEVVTKVEELPIRLVAAYPKLTAR